ncbi:hypothetical protein PG994_000467 [Apiospora phragmitis]|uniref:Uncharacterized protein n=1 Tax=Apiospora phragmitis TaxID=2905665 RepID=A0ABR1X6J8_9PEZI
MATRYPIDILLHLRQSPLCVKPSTLPPPEDWMGPPPETFRNAQGTGGVKTGTERTRNDTSLLDGTSRRPGVDRHASRNSANPDDIVLGPPRTTFTSATLLRGSKPFDNDKTDRFAQLRRNGEGDAPERNNKDRDGRKDFRRRENADQDSDGWSTVKPRKSFGHEGAERFHGRMGERPEKLAPERRLRDGHGDDSEDKKPRRNNFGEFGRDRDADESEKPRRNGLPRNKTDQPPWSRGNNADAEPPSARERFDRGKSWRDRDEGDKPKDRNYDRRWDRDHRQEREPEWLDEPAEESAQGHTEADLKKFMESMKASKGGTARADAPTATLSNLDTNRGNVLEAEKSKIKSAPAMEMGPDKFFANFSSPPPGTDRVNHLEAARDNGAPAKPKTGSRFQNFFSAQGGQERQTEPPTPSAGPPASGPALMNPLLAFVGAAASSSSHPQPHPQPQHAGSSDIEEKAAFESLIQKLHKQKPFTNTPPSGGFPAPQQAHEAKGSVSSPGPFQDSLGCSLPPQQPYEIHAPKPQQVPQLPPQLPPMRPDQQMLHELIGQRHPSLSNQGGRDQIPSRNSKEEFLMTLMQSARNPPEVTRPEQYIRMPQPSRPAQIPQTPDRDGYPRDRGSAQHQGRPQGLPAFFDEAQLIHEHEQRRHQQQQQQQQQPPQPTQILQRQVPPGLDQVHPNWMQGNQHLPHVPGGPGGRPMIPPPGLAGSRNGPMPGNFPPNFPPGIAGAFPPEGFRGPPAPPGFYGGPPPGLFPPGFQPTPEQIPYGGFDGRGMPPGGAFRR